MKTRKHHKTVKKYTAGQIVEYRMDSLWHFNWTPLYVHTMDCGPNCFCLLGYSSWETSNKLAIRTPDGITGDEVILILNHAYGTKHDWVHIPTNDYKKINDYLHLNEATIASIGTDEWAHFFVVLKDQYGLHAINAQGGQSGPLKTYILFMEENGYEQNSFYIVSSRYTLTGPKDYDKVTMKLVKQYFPTTHEVQLNSEQPDEVLTKEQRRHHRKIMRLWGYETTPDTSVESSPSMSPNLSSSPEWTLPTSRSRAGRRAKMERKYRSKSKT